jgi:hypothetical protein
MDVITNLKLIILDDILPDKKPTLRPSMATAGLVIAARNDFQVNNN